MHNPFIRRRLTTFAAALATVALVAPALSAEAAAPVRARTAAGALDRYLAANGDHFHTTFDGTEYADYGLTLDGVIAMDAAGVGDATSARATRYVASHLVDYIGDGKTEAYAGATAKALFVSLSQRSKPKGTLSGVNLIARLKSLQTPSGRFSDKSQWGDYSNVIGQSFALMALRKAHRKVPFKAIVFLRNQQCGNGGFRLNPGPGACAADPDATSFAVQGLLASPQTRYTKHRIARAVRYLRHQMERNGGVHGGASTTAPNTNSTALAALAFSTTGHPRWAKQARKFLRSMRYTCSYPSSMRGAFAYNAAGRKAAAGQGAKARLSDEDLRATTQATLGFVHHRLFTVSNAKAKRTSPYVKC